MALRSRSSHSASKRGHKQTNHKFLALSVRHRTPARHLGEWSFLFMVINTEKRPTTPQGQQKVKRICPEENNPTEEGEDRY